MGGDCRAPIAHLAAGAGVRVLRNQMAEVGGLQIVGLDELWANRFDPRRGLAGLKTGQAALVLSHNPDTADEPGWGSYTGWSLSGHTHGGQCKRLQDKQVFFSFFNNVTPTKLSHRLLS